MYDFIIKNARIIDGTSAPWFRGSVAVKDGKIAEIGPAHGKLMQDAAEVVDGPARCRMRSGSRFQYR